MDDVIAWRRFGSRAAWVVAGTFLAASLMLLLLSFNITASEPTIPANGDLIDRLLGTFQNEALRWPQELAQQLLFAVGFLAVAGLGPVLRRLIGGDGPGVAMVSTLFIGAGMLGVVAQLFYVGAKEIAIDPHYCDCQYAPHTLIARDQALGMISNAQSWLINGFIFLFAAGLLVMVRIASARGLLPAGWLAFSRLLAVAGLITALFQTVVPPLLNAMSIEGVDTDQIGNLLVLVVAGIMIPVWAIWLARSLRDAVESTVAT